MQTVCPLGKTSPPFFFFASIFFPSSPSFLPTPGRRRFFFFLPSVTCQCRQAVHGLPQCVTLMISLVECITVRNSSLYSSSVCLPAVSVGRHTRTRARTHAEVRAIFISSTRTGLDFSAPFFTLVGCHPASATHPEWQTCIGLRVELIF